jgi:hypothetical protein
MMTERFNFRIACDITAILNLAFFFVYFVAGDGAGSIIETIENYRNRNEKKVELDEGKT